MTTPASTFEVELVELRSYLLRFARLQLRNDEWAQDVVSETLLAALSKPQAFGNRSQLKTWLVGILKHKILDVYRLRAKEFSRDDANTDEASVSEDLDGLVFKQDGHFQSNPRDWGSPDQDLSSKQFFAILELCTDKLPAAMARVFLMREWLELSSEEICKELALSSTNLHVQLHRARLRLRECLEINWFGAPRKAS